MITKIDNACIIKVVWNWDHSIMRYLTPEFTDNSKYKLPLKHWTFFTCLQNYLPWKIKVQNPFLQKNKAKRSWVHLVLLHNSSWYARKLKERKKPETCMCAKLFLPLLYASLSIFRQYFWWSYDLSMMHVLLKKMKLIMQAHNWNIYAGKMQWDFFFLYYIGMS